MPGEDKEEKEVEEKRRCEIGFELFFDVLKIDGAGLFISSGGRVRISMGKQAVHVWGKCGLFSDHSMLRVASLY